ncbi:MAG TPA: Atxe2 family lasso peptide isopeptidase [Acetobacteraceae bacterium]|nr:Atxe2 family lasso peptide isopeptidase [Acetobacteraceae bacterium]
MIGLVLAVAAAIHPTDADPIDRCQRLLPQSVVSVPASRQSITIEDLMQVRDIGQPGVEAAGLSLSPDHRKVAFQLRQADPGSNSYCQAIIVVSLSTRAPSVIDRGGEFMALTYPRYGIAEYPSGIPALVTPRWSPDGRWLAYLRRDHGLTAAWIAHSDGGDARAVSPGNLDLADLRWSADGRRLILSARPMLVEAEQAIDREGLSGYHIDDRVVPMAGYRPFPTGPLPRVALALDLATNSLGTASASDAALLAGDRSPGNPPSAHLFASARDGRQAWTAPDSSAYDAPEPLHVRTTKGAVRACGAPACDGHIIGLWWIGGHLFFLHREGPGYGDLGFYRWDVGNGEPRRVFQTDHLLIDCTSVDAQLLCADEASLQPRRIVLVDIHSGRMRTVFDPNPQAFQFALGPVRRLIVAPDEGPPTFADLVLPPHADVRHRYPLVVVQYVSRGLLRGGTGDNYPILPLAAHGFAVLSFQRPPQLPVDAHATSMAEAFRQDTRDWRDRRNVQSALSRAIDAAIQTGTVDPARLGISGQSDGTATIAFALIGTRIFKAAAMSTCCEDSFSVMTAPGLNGTPLYRAAGFPSLTSPNPDFWKPASIAANAKSLDTPLLLQLSDDEATLGLQSFMSLKEQRKPVDMYVFPDERHATWQPAHRLAIYRRSIAWFEFWLQGIEDHACASLDEMDRWRDMRSLWQQAGRPTSSSGATNVSLPRAEP